MNISSSYEIKYIYGINYLHNDWFFTVFINKVKNKFIYLSYVVFCSQKFKFLIFGDSSSLFAVHWVIGGGESGIDFIGEGEGVNKLFSGSESEVESKGGKGKGLEGVIFKESFIKSFRESGLGVE